VTRKRHYRPPPGSSFTDDILRVLSRPVDLPEAPWRYSTTPALVRSLISVSGCAGEMRAAPISYYRRKELEARARRVRIRWTVKHVFSSVRLDEVDAVLRGARLRDDREKVAHVIRKAAVVEDALEHYVGSQGALSPELAMAYREALCALPSGDERVWLRFTGRERTKLLELHRGSVPVPEPVRALFEWVNEDDLVSSSPVLRAATLYWGLTLLFPDWSSAQVIVHHELRAGRIDPHGLLMLTDAGYAHRDVLAKHPGLTADADDGDLTGYFEHFTGALELALRERLIELGRAKDAEAHLAWKVVAPPDAIDVRLFETVERLGRATSSAIVSALGTSAPPLRTVQRRLSKLVADGVLLKRGARKNAVYSLSGEATEG
jgi:hypothetical protein